MLGDQDTGYYIFTGINHQWTAAEICSWLLMGSIVAHQGGEQAGKDEQWQRGIWWMCMKLFNILLPPCPLYPSTQIVLLQQT